MDWNFGGIVTFVTQSPPSTRVAPSRLTIILAGKITSLHS